MARVGMGSVLAGAAAGAYAMQASSQGGWSNLWGLVPRSWDAPVPGAVGSSDVAALRGEMARLAGVVSELARGGHRPTVVHLGGKSGWAVLVYPTLAGGACVYLYCRVTGSSPLDLLFVSRGSMASFRHVVAEGLSNVWAELRRHKEEFVRMVTTLGSKQDQLQDSQQQLMERQAQMDTVLQRVDGNVDGLDAKASRTMDHVDQMDGRLQDVHVGVQAANQGIYMLMSVVSEVTAKIGLHNSRATQSLTRYLQGGPAWSGGSSAASATATPSTTTSSSISSVASSGTASRPASITQGPPLLALPPMPARGAGGEEGEAGGTGRQASTSLGGLKDLMPAGEAGSGHASFIGFSGPLDGRAGLPGVERQGWQGDAAGRALKQATSHAVP